MNKKTLCLFVGVLAAFVGSAQAFLDGDRMQLEAAYGEPRSVFPKPEVGEIIRSYQYKEYEVLVTFVGGNAACLGVSRIDKQQLAASEVDAWLKYLSAGNDWSDIKVGDGSKSTWVRSDLSASAQLNEEKLTLIVSSNSYLSNQK